MIRFGICMLSILIPTYNYNALPLVETIEQQALKAGIVFQDFKLLNDRAVNGNLEFVLKATGWKNKQEISDRIEDVLTK